MSGPPAARPAAPNPPRVPALPSRTPNDRSSESDKWGNDNNNSNSNNNTSNHSNRSTSSTSNSNSNKVSTNGVTADFMFFDRGTFWVLPLTYFYIPKSARAYLFPKSVKIHYLCSGPLSVDPTCPQPRSPRRLAASSKFPTDRRQPNSGHGQTTASFAAPIACWYMLAGGPQPSVAL